MTPVVEIPEELWLLMKSRQERDEFQRNTGDKTGIMSDIKI